MLVLIAASKATFKLSESPKLTETAMTTIRRFAADDAHVIYGTAYDETLGDQLRVTVIATGLSSAARRVDGRATPPLSVVQPQAHAFANALRTGTDNLPIHHGSSHQGHSQPQSGLGNGVSAPPQHSYEGLNTPSVWRSARSQAAAKVDALSSNGMDEIEIPAFLRKQAD